MKDFKCAAISSTRNSFGLRGAIFIALDGEAWEVGVHDIDAPEVGHVYGVLIQTCHCAEETGHSGCECGQAGTRLWGRFGWEIPRRLPQAPDKVVESVWGSVAKEK